jgi:hypothetical protein
MHSPPCRPGFLVSSHVFICPAVMPPAAAMYAARSGSKTSGNFASIAFAPRLPVLTVLAVPVAAGGQVCISHVLLASVEGALPQGETRLSCI